MALRARRTYTASASASGLTVGPYRVGRCGQNREASVAISSNDYAGGWFMVVN